MAKAAGWMKLVLALVLTGVLGAAAALVALKAFFPEPKLRAMVLDGARKQLGREVRLEHLSLGLRGLSLDGLEVSEFPDFKAGTFVSVERFRLRPSWRALLRRKLVVSTVDAEGLTVRVARGADGAFNFSTLASSAPAPAAPSAASAERPEFSVHRVKVSRGVLSYDDPAAGQSWRVSDAELSVTGFGLAAPFDASFSLRARGKAGARAVDATLSFDGEIDPARGEPAKLKVKARALRLETEGLTLKASGLVDGLAPPRATFDATVSAAGKAVLEAEGSVRLSSASGGDFSAQVKARTDGLDTTLLAKWLPSAGVPALTVPAATLDLVAERRGAAAEVKTFSLAWKDGKADGRLSAKGLGTRAPVYDGAVTVAASLPAVAPGQYPFLKLPPKVSLPASRVDGRVSFAGDAARVESLKVAVPQGTVSVAGSVAKLGAAAPVPDLLVTLALALPAVKAGDLPVALPPSVPASFVLPATRLDGAVRLKGDDARLQALSLGFAGGKVTLDGAVLKYLSAARRPELEAVASLTLPALTDKDLPVPGVPPGLQLPASSWEADLDYTLERLRVRKLRVKLGGNDLAVEGTVGDPAGRMAYDLLVKCKSFVLEELTKLTPQTRELELKGSGFVAMSVTGSGAKPVFAGKAQFRGAGATVAGLPLSEFNGTASFDERRLDVPNLKGKVADGSLEMDLTVKDFAKSPEVTLDASLDRFDLGRFLDAKKRYAAEHPPKTAAPSKDGAAAGPPPALRTRGSFAVGALSHPQATVSQVKLSWDLTGVASDLRRLNGGARLSVAQGRLRGAKEMAAANPALKVLMLPVVVVSGLGRFLAGVPDLSDIAVHSITGDYLFKDGVMHLRDSRLDSDKVEASAAGSVDLPKEALDLVVTAQVGRILPTDIEVRGTVSDPKPKVKVGKLIGDMIQTGVQGLLQKAVKPTE
ncbi:MAG: AsmA-like C-terminal region-containing protein [Elusimicrobiota bacterium]|nr:AsmA-like C-terminal region-containing protein [Elusimicrobiota bacterium]